MQLLNNIFDVLWVFVPERNVATCFFPCLFYFDSPIKYFRAPVWLAWYCRGHEGCNNTRLIGIAARPAQVALLSNRFCYQWSNPINLLTYTVHHLAHVMFHLQLKCATKMHWCALCFVLFQSDPFIWSQFHTAWLKWDRGSGEITHFGAAMKSAWC